MKIAYTAEIYQYAGDSVFHVYRLLEEVTLTPGQAEEIGRSPVKRVFREEDGGKDDKALPLAQDRELPRLIPGAFLCVLQARQ